MDKTMVSQMSRGQGHEFLNKLEAAGLNSHLCQKVIDSKNNELATKVVRLIEHGGFEASTSQKSAREIMGKNFFGTEEAIKYFGVNPSKGQLDFFAGVPFPEEVLRFVKNTHILVAVFKMSVLDIRLCVIDKGLLFFKQDWYNSMAFAKDKGEVGWQLIRKTPVAGSINRTWGWQKALLAENEETPTAQVMVYSIIGHFLANGEKLFIDVYVRTSSLDSVGNNVSVGIFDFLGLTVCSGRGEKNGCIGLASAFDTAR